MGRLKKLKKIRIHREGTHILWASFLLLLLMNAALYWGIDCKIPFYVVAVASIAIYLLMVNFFRCPIRLFGQDTEKIVGKRSGLSYAELITKFKDQLFSVDQMVLDALDECFFMLY